MQNEPLNTVEGDVRDEIEIKTLETDIVLAPADAQVLRVWIEHDILGDYHVMTRHGSKRSFCYSSFHYDREHNTGAAVLESAIALAKTLGAGASVELRTRPVAESRAEVMVAIDRAIALGRDLQRIEDVKVVTRFEQTALDGKTCVAEIARRIRESAVDGSATGEQP